MNVTDYIQRNLITLDLRSKKKDNLIRELSQLVKGRAEIVDYERFLEDVFERERLGTTGIGDEIALPHARTDSVSRLIIAFGRSKQGVEFGSIDGRKARIFFLMGTPRESVSQYLRILAQLTRLLKHGPLRERLLEVEGRNSVVTLFRQASQRG